MSWYSNLLTKTSSQINNLRSTLLSGEADGDTEDDTHVCRVLRGYYTEKGRPFPPWLPVDPKAPQQQQAPLPGVTQAGGPGARYGQPVGGAPAGGGLSSLWDKNGAGQGAPPAPQSLRAGRPVPTSLQPGRPGDARSRAGSYQSVGGGRPETASVPPGGGAAAAAGSGGGGGSAQDRLRQRLWGGSRTTSPSQGSQGPFQPPAPAPAPSGGGGGSYEDRFAPGGMYDSTGGGGARQGLPSGPGPRRGLPSGPRGYR